MLAALVALNGRIDCLKEMIEMQEERTKVLDEYVDNLSHEIAKRIMFQGKEGDSDDGD